MAIDRLIEVNPLGSELCHVLSNFTYFLKVLTLTCCDRVGNVEEGEGLLVKSAIESQKLLVRCSRLPLQALELKLCVFLDFRRAWSLAHCICKLNLGQTWC